MLILQFIREGALNLKQMQRLYFVWDYAYCSKTISDALYYN